MTKNIRKSLLLKRPLLFCALYLIMGFFIIRPLKIIPDIVKAFLALPTFVILPWLFGEFIKLIVSKISILLNRMKNEYLFTIFKYEEKNLFIYFFLLWIIGMYAITTVAAFLQFIGLFKLIWYIIASVFIIIIINEINEINSLLKSSTNSVSFISNSSNSTSRNTFRFQLTTYTLILLLFISALPVMIASIFLPYPLFGLNHDMPLRIQYALRVIDYNYLMLNSRIPETLLFAFGGVLFGPTLLGYVWALRFLGSFIFVVGVYLFAYQITKDNIESLITSFASAFLFSGCSNIARGELFFNIFAQQLRSNTILFAFYPYILYFIEYTLSEDYEDLKHIRNLIMPFIIFALIITSIFIYLEIPEDIYFGWPMYSKLYYVNPILYLFLPFSVVIFRYHKIAKEKSIRDTFSILYIIALCFFLIHVEEAPIFVGTSALYLLLRSLYIAYGNKAYYLPYKIKIKITTIVNLFSSFAVFLFVFLQKTENLPLELLNIPFLRSWWYIDINFKLNEFFAGNGIVALILLIIGIIYLSVKNKHVEQTIALMFVFYLFIYFLPIPWSYRIYKEMNPLAAFIVARTFYDISKKIYPGVPAINNYMTHFSKGLLNKHTFLKFIRFITLILFVISFTTTLIMPIWVRFSARAAFIPETQTAQTLITNEELQLAYFLRDHLPSNVRIVSDFFSMWLLTPLANKIWVVEKNMPQGLSDRGRETVLFIKQNILQATNSSAAYTALFKLADYTPLDEELFINKTGNEPAIYVVIISRRTSYWITHMPEDSVAFSYYLDKHINPGLLNIFNGSIYFKIIYSVPGEIYAFLANPMNSTNNIFTTQGLCTNTSSADL